MVEELHISIRPDAVFDMIHSKPFSFFLDSGMDRCKLGKYSFIGYNPFLIFKSKGERIDVTMGRETHTMMGNPFRILNSIIGNYRISSDGTIPPFIGEVSGIFPMTSAILLNDYQRP